MTQLPLDHAHTILVAGAHGMVGQAVCRVFRNKGYKNLLTPSHKELDYTDQLAVRCYLRDKRPDVILIAAGKVGGVIPNQQFPADFLAENTLIATHLIHEAHRADIHRVLYLGSTCIYPRDCPQPIKEEYLLTSPLETTNAAYALAKIVGVKLCEYYNRQYERDYISAMPTNLYGPADSYHPMHSHVVPGLIRRIHEAKCKNRDKVTVWGTGQVLREFLYVDDLAHALLLLLKKYHDPETVNIGTEEELTIQELAYKVQKAVGFEGILENDISKPDGTPRKKTEASKILSLGWRPKIQLDEGLAIAYQDFLERESALCSC